MSKPVDTEKYWEDRLNTFADHLPSSVYCTSKAEFDAMDKRHLEILAPYKDKKVLDAGCAYGRFSPYFNDYTGIDFVNAFINKAKKLYPDKRFEVQNLKDLPYDNQLFDMAFCVMVKNNVIGNLGSDAWDEMEKELKRVAKELIILEP